MTGETRTITLTVEFEVSCFEDRSGMTSAELARAVYDAVEAERNVLVTEAKIAAIHLLAGDAPSRSAARDHEWGCHCNDCMAPWDQHFYDEGS